MLNRAVLILRYKQPFVDWINAADPDSTQTITLNDANEGTTAYLIDEINDDDEFEGWLALNVQLLFEEELNAWYTDPKLWPQERSLALLRQWCTLELHTVVVDTGSSRLYDDEVEKGDQ